MSLYDVSVQAQTWASEEKERLYWLTGAHWINVLFCFCKVSPPFILLYVDQNSFFAKFAALQNLIIKSDVFIVWDLIFSRIINQLGARTDEKMLLIQKLVVAHKHTYT